MTAKPEERLFVREDVRKAFAALDVRPGFRAKLVDEEIIISPPTDGQHETLIVPVDT